ncbi:antitoxin HicB [Bacteroidia bacterium]|nr:antitoxin HicB [Bacteroidia bacterium]
MINNLEYKGYYGSVEYSKEDNCLCGKVLGMTKDCISYEGTTVAELEQDFRNGIDSYLEGCKELGIQPRKAYSGVLNIRIPSELHCWFAIMAEKQNTSINALVHETLEKRMAFAN